MSVQYHKLLDRILIRRAAERESLERQVAENRAAPKVLLAFFCFMLAGGAMLFFAPLALIPAAGGFVALFNAFGAWRQSRVADEALDEEIKDEEYRRYLLGKLGGQKFDQLAGAVASGGSEQSIQGWLKPAGFDEQDIAYLLWLAESIVAQVNEGVVQVGGYGPGARPKPAAKPEPAKPEPQAEPPKSEAADIDQPAHEHRNLSPEEVEKFRQLAAKRKHEYEQWKAAGGRETSPDDPLGKLGRFTPEQIAELKKKAQQRREKGEAPQSNAPAPAAKDHPEKFSEKELHDLEKKALSRFEPRPGDGKTINKQEVLGEVFSDQDIQNLASKAERKEAERKSLPKAEENDKEFGE